MTVLIKAIFLQLRQIMITIPELFCADQWIAMHKIEMKGNIGSYRIGKFLLILPGHFGKIIDAVSSHDILAFGQVYSTEIFTSAGQKIHQPVLDLRGQPFHFRGGACMVDGKKIHNLNTENLPASGECINGLIIPHTTHKPDQLFLTKQTRTIFRTGNHLQPPACLLNR